MEIGLVMDQLSLDRIHQRIALRHGVKSEVCQAITFVPLEIKWSLIWASPHHSDIDRKALRTKIRTVALGPNNPAKVYGEFPLE
jgi:hypothetical protein